MQLTQELFISVEECPTEFIEIINLDFYNEIVIRLYLKQHSVTKLMYFGMTKQNPSKYLGSGVHWKRHIKKHGIQFVKTLKVWSFNHLPDATEFALKFSEDNNIVESNEWANIISETALGSSDYKVSDETKRKQSAAQKKRYSDPEERQKMSDSGKASWTPELRQAQSERHLGRKHSLETKSKQSAAHKGKSKSDDHKEKIKEAWKNRLPDSDETKLNKRNSRLGAKIYNNGIISKMFKETPDSSEWVPGFLN